MNPWNMEMAAWNSIYHAMRARGPRASRFFR